MLAAAAATTGTTAAVPSVTGHGNTNRDSLPSGDPNPGQPVPRPRGVDVRGTTRGW